MYIIINISSLLIEDQINIRKELAPYFIRYVSEMLLVVTLNDKVDDILYKYNIFEYKPYK